MIQQAVWYGLANVKGRFLQVYNPTFIQNWTVSHHTLYFPPEKKLYTGVIKKRVLYFQLIRSMQILVPCDVRFVKNLQIAEAWNFNKLVKNV